ncbi:MAG TPA: methyltransferase domain-containing protein [Gammaproteobacteria bacterium]
MDGQDLQPHDGAPAPGSFFLSWLQSPFSVGAVAPSGRELGRLMTLGIGPGSRVLELGAGTGTLTQAILDRGVSPADLFAVEQNPKFAAILKDRFPSCTIVTADAQSLSRHLHSLRGSMDYVVSGLPLLLFTARQKMRVLEQAFSMLMPQGCLHQFTYGGRCSVGRALLSRLGLDAALIGVAARNIPPAFVYRLTRAHD